MKRERLFNGKLKQFIRDNRLIRRGALAAGVVVGLYFIGRGLGWW